jgi:hypothetical protein
VDHGNSRGGRTGPQHIAALDRKLRTLPAIRNVLDRPRSEFSILRLLLRGDEFMNRFSAAFVVALVVLFAVWAWFGSRAARFEFDELLEISAASAPTSHDVLSFLASGVDFNPPLSHFLIRAAMSQLGDAEWVTRLPAFLGFVVLILAMYALVARRCTPAYGIVAMLLTIGLPLRTYAIQARPYGIVLGLSALAVTFYLQAVEYRSRTFSLCALAICTGAMVASHYYEVLVVAVLLVMELIRGWETNRMDWPLVACCIGPPVVVLFLLRRAIVQQKQVLTHYFARGNLLSFDHGYDDLKLDPLIYCVAFMLLIGALSLVRGASDDFVPAARFRAVLRGREVQLGLALLSLPIVGAFVTQFVTHAYVPRYFLAAGIGLVICCCYVVRFLSPAVPGLTLILVLSIALGFGKSILQEKTRSAEALPALASLTAQWTPLLFDSPAAYERIYHYFPALRDNLWVIADPAASMRYRNYDTDDRIMLALAAHGRAQAVTLSAAVRKWPQFRLVPRSADSVWALKCIMDAGVPVHVSQPFGSSNFIFDVAVSADSVAKIDACSQ